MVKVPPDPWIASRVLARMASVRRGVGAFKSSWGITHNPTHTLIKTQTARMAASVRIHRRSML